MFRMWPRSARFSYPGKIIQLHLQCNPPLKYRRGSEDSRRIARIKFAPCKMSGDRAEVRNLNKRACHTLRDGTGTPGTVLMLCTEAEAARILRLVRRLLPKLGGHIRLCAAGD